MSLVMACRHSFFCFLVMHPEWYKCCTTACGVRAEHLPTTALMMRIAAASACSASLLHRRSRRRARHSCRAGLRAVTANMPPPATTPRARLAAETPKHTMLVPNLRAILTDLTRRLVLDLLNAFEHLRLETPTSRCRPSSLLNSLLSSGAGPLKRVADSFLDDTIRLRSSAAISSATSLASSSLSLSVSLLPSKTSSTPSLSLLSLF
mmetsp:Transcript_16243/g.40415  ORF Transcript_16243/g.40415 Transcript_16243/m.40415 type:complete len:207 (+) Transcript_16243:1639-2259(+)